MILEDIGFYTLEDERAKTSNEKTPLWRCELILTDRCNFNCTYCRGIRKEDQGDISLQDAIKIIDLWTGQGLRNVRFSGGEPTLWVNLPELIKYSKTKGIKRIALSTNGSNDLDFYLHLIDCGINDFSISLDSCCSTNGDKISGNIQGSWEKVISNIKELSKKTYVTIGVVLTNDNMNEINEIIKFSSSMNVSDIRIITASQNNSLFEDLFIDDIILNKHPILKYRYNNFKNGRRVRGITSGDYYRCPLVLDDMAVLNGQHYPCIIYLREQGKPIGKVGENMREERKNWFENHRTVLDPICKKNCLDVYIDFNNRWKFFHSFQGE